MTTVAPNVIGTFSPPCMPSMWNKGATAKNTESMCMLRQTCAAMLEASTVACVCMQPLGWPVVPEV
jgi:hypothetical protein